ncbi:EAL domain-containing protein [Citrobacter freundii]|uniref:EAL domain-containing protein n=1 Tax=Citrobacter freundii TaxID=546 RepID=UPI001EF00981|nr:EAL domain-containing protein [Citrobacter freundii]
MEVPVLRVLQYTCQYVIRSSFSYGGGYFLRNTHKEIKPVFEVTERIKISTHPEDVRIIKSLSADGIPLWLDDFCTGHSNLDSLKTGLFSGIKIPGELVKNNSVKNLIDNIHLSLNEAGRQLHISLIAEGIETLNQLNYIKREGIDLAQGYFLCPPLCGSDFSDYIKKFY